MTKIGSSVYFGNPHIARVVIPEGVSEIGENAFSGCKNLISVTLPQSLRTIGAGAFQGCVCLTCVTIPTDVNAIGEDAFEDCKELDTVYIFDITAWCRISFETSFSNPLMFAKHFCCNGENIRALVIPDGTENTIIPYL